VKDGSSYPSVASSLFPEDYQLLCLDFIKENLEEVIQEVKILEIVQEMFKSKVVNDEIEMACFRGMLQGH